MPPPSDASPIRVALIDDDSGLVTVLDRRFAALRWQRELIGYAAGPDQLAALRLPAAIVNPAVTGLDYIGRTSGALPGLALLVCTGTAPVADQRADGGTDVGHRAEHAVQAAPPAEPRPAPSERPQPTVAAAYA